MQGVRYGETHEDAEVQRIVDRMQDLSADLAHREELMDVARLMEQLAASLPPGMTPQDLGVDEKFMPFYEQNPATTPIISDRMEAMVQGLREIRRFMEELEEEQDV